MNQMTGIYNKSLRGWSKTERIFRQCGLETSLYLATYDLTRTGSEHMHYTDTLSPSCTEGVKHPGFRDEKTEQIILEMIFNKAQK